MAYIYRNSISISPQLVYGSILIGNKTLICVVVEIISIGKNKKTGQKEKKIIK